MQGASGSFSEEKEGWLPAAGRPRLAARPKKTLLPEALD
jgi:hypothetical protein